MNEYDTRDNLLFQLGFSNYRDYLASEIWKAIRVKTLRKYPSCAVCGRKAVQVHHVKYTLDVLSGKSDKWLLSVCRTCHERSEVDSLGNKRSWIDSQKTMLSLMQKHTRENKRKPKGRSRPEIGRYHAKRQAAKRKRKTRG